jgi:RNA polymerase sigma-70 factor (ECF subfamily)
MNSMLAGTSSFPTRSIDRDAEFMVIRYLGGEARRFIRRTDGWIWNLQQQPQQAAQTVPSPDEAQSSRWQRHMAAAQQGDQRAYSSLLTEASPFIRFIARRFHSNHATIDDVVQDTLLTIHRIRHTYEPGRAVEPWIAAIARARAIDALRAHKRRTARDAGLTPEMMAELPNQASSSVEADLAAAGEVAAALATLPQAQRDAVRLLRIQEMSLAEAARASGRSVGALKSLLHRAMQTLRSPDAGGKNG